MKQRSERMVGARVGMVMLAVLVAVTVAGIGARSAGAAPANQVCDVIVGQQPVNGSAEAQPTVTGQNSEAGQASAGQITTCSGDAGFGFGVGPGLPSTCTMTLPEGALPGSTVVVTTSPGGMVGQACSIQIVPPGGAGFGVPGVATGGYYCEALPAVEGSAGVPATPEAGASGSADVTVVMPPDVTGSDCSVFQVSPGAVVTGPGVESGCMVVITGEPATGAGGTQSGTNGASTEQGDSTGAGSTQKGGEAGMAGAGQTQAVEGQVQVCAEPVPGSVQPGGDGSTSSNDTGSRTYLCTTPDSNDPNVITCTAQP